MTINFYLVIGSAILLLSAQLSIHLPLQLSNCLIIMLITFNKSIVKGLNLAINVGSQIPNFLELPHYLGAKLRACFQLYLLCYSRTNR